jgi:hypothetical protein
LVSTGPVCDNPAGGIECFMNGSEPGFAVIDTLIAAEPVVSVPQLEENVREHYKVANQDPQFTERLLGRGLLP